MFFTTALVLLAANFAGLWSAEQRYAGGGGTQRDSMWVQNAGGTFDYRWAIPARESPKPLEDVIHLNLIAQTQADGTLSAFVRNPELNIGALIGTRRLVVINNVARLEADGRPPITGSYDERSDSLTFRFDQLPGRFVFHRAPIPTPTPYVYRVPQEEHDGWQTGSLDFAGMSKAGIAKIIDSEINVTNLSLRSPYIQSLTIARHGKLVLDEYFNGFDAQMAHDVRSAGKSVTTLMLGRAMEDDRGVTPQSRVNGLLTRYAPFANDDARKNSITLADLMSMQSGYACDDNDDASPGNEDAMQSQTKQPDWYKYALDLPMQNDPGTKAIYCTAGINLLGAIIAGSTREWLPEYFDERFARPMQFGWYGMWITPPPVSDAYMGGGDRFRPRDFLKFGELFLDHGKWHGTQIVDDAWLQAIATKRSTIEGEIGDYGWGWHLYTYDVGAQKIAAIGAGGNGGQLVFAFPQLDMTVMITAANYGQYPVWSKFVTQLVPELLNTVRT